MTEIPTTPIGIIFSGLFLAAQLLYRWLKDKSWGKYEDDTGTIVSSTGTSNKISTGTALGQLYALEMAEPFCVLGLL